MPRASRSTARSSVWRRRWPMDDDIRDEEALLAIASKIDADQPIDWEAEASDARTEEERAVLAELRILAALARVSRDPELSEGAAGSEGALIASPAEPPVAWGSLTILELVGRGAFGVVYRARDALNREVALKLFPRLG